MIQEKWKGDYRFPHRRAALNRFRGTSAAALRTHLGTLDQLGRSCIALILWPDLSKDDGCALETAFQASQARRRRTAWRIRPAQDFARGRFIERDM